MAKDEHSGETPDGFLAGIAVGLAEQEGADTHLIDILKEHILTATPTQNAVAQAKEAILSLAAARANSPELEKIDG